MRNKIRDIYFWLFIAVSLPLILGTAEKFFGFRLFTFDNDTLFIIDTLLMLLFFAQIILANQTFGKKGGIISAFGSGVFIALRVVNGTHNNEYLIIIAGIVGIGICTSLLLDRQEKEKKQMILQAEERHNQMAKLNREIAERERTEKENIRLLEAYKQQNALIIKSNLELETAIAQIKETEAELISSEQRFKKLFNETNDAIFIHDFNGNLIDVNRRSYELLGYPKKDLLDIPMSQLFQDEVRDSSVKALDSIINKGSFRYESVLVKSDGAVINVDISSKIVDRDRRVIQSTARDITELKKTLQQLRHSQVLASLGEMTAGIAHEVNNPLGIVLLYLDLLKQNDLPRDVKKDIRVIHDEVTRAAKIMSDLLTYGSGAVSGHQRINVHHLINKVADMRRYEEKVLDIETTTRLSDQPLYTFGGSSQLTQVFMNLILNAEEALKGQGGGEIVISTWAEDEWLKISFSDNGPGIPEEHLNQIFHPFFTTKAIGEGTGLGLSMCYGIVTAQGGLIHAENNPQGGANFIVELPLAHENPDKKRVRRRVPVASD